MRKPLFIITVTTIFVLTLVTLALAADPFVGTWKLNVAKSKTTDPSTMPKSEMFKNVGMDNGFKTTYDGVDVDGKAYHLEASVKYDGKEFPITGFPLLDTGTTKKIDDTTHEVTGKKAGKEMERWRVIVSKDGKTQTWTGKATNPKGQAYNATFVYDRQ